MRAPNDRRPRGRGFTLVEILIVVTILGIIAGIVLPHYQRTTVRAQTAALVTDLQMIRQSLQIYETEHRGEFPLLLEMWGNLTSSTNAFGAPGVDFGPYIHAAPTNQITGGSACAANNLADWKYDETNGSIRAVVPAAIIAEFNLSPLDAVAAP